MTFQCALATRLCRESPDRSSLLSFPQGIKGKSVPSSSHATKIAQLVKEDLVLDVRNPLRSEMPEMPKEKSPSQRKETQTFHKMGPSEAKSSKAKSPESHHRSPKFAWPFSLETFRRVDEYRLPNYGIESTTRSTDKDRIKKGGIKIPETSEIPKKKSSSERKETVTFHKIRPSEAKSSESRHRSPKFVWPFSFETFRRVDEYRLPNYGIEATTHSTDKDGNKKAGAEAAPAADVREDLSVYFFVIFFFAGFVSYFSTHWRLTSPPDNSDLYLWDVGFVGLRSFLASFITSLVLGYTLGKFVLSRRGKDPEKACPSFSFGITDLTGDIGLFSQFATE